MHSRRASPGARADAGGTHGGQAAHACFMWLLCVMLHTCRRTSSAFLLHVPAGCDCWVHGGPYDCDALEGVHRQ